MTTDELIKRFQKENMEALLSEAEQAFEPALSLLTQENAAAISFLARLAKQKKYRQAIIAHLEKQPLLQHLLQSDEPKIRKNTARLIGQLQRPGDGDILIQALQKEPTRYVKPSMILALGALKTPETEKFLADYQVTPAADETEVKHERAEKEALLTARQSAYKTQGHKFKGYRGYLELRCSRGLEKNLAQALEALGPQSCTVEKTRPGRVLIRVHCYENLFKVRLWREALIPLYQNVEQSKLATEKAEDIQNHLLKVLGYAYEGKPPYAFRVELAGKAEEAKQLARALMGPKLMNAPSHYEVELRVESWMCKLGRVNVYIRLCAVPDPRFSYRTEAVAASIHPVNAAGIMAIAAPYLGKDAIVFDPCCGSGTLLIERAKFGSCKKRIGTDIQVSAVRAARTNLKRVGLAAQIELTDCLDFRPEEPVDEIFSNLPFGNRVGTHGQNEKLYKGLINRLPLWLKPGGVAVFYTAEGKLMDSLLMKQRAIKLMAKYRLEAGGLEPYIFILQYSPL